MLSSLLIFLNGIESLYEGALVYLKGMGGKGFTPQTKKPTIVTQKGGNGGGGNSNTSSIASQMKQAKGSNCKSCGKH